MKKEGFTKKACKNEYSDTTWK